MLAPPPQRWRGWSDGDDVHFEHRAGASAFVAGIDTYAAAVGDLHGRYPVPKELDLELLQRIRDALDCNISLHGGSGTPGHYFQEAARLGVSKINVNSDLRYAYRTTLEAQLKANPDQYAVVKIIGPVIDAVQGVVEERIDLFGSAGHAQP
jgi:fructose-bisphosphate aldolase class II